MKASETTISTQFMKRSDDGNYDYKLFQKVFSIAEKMLKVIQKSSVFQYNMYYEIYKQKLFKYLFKG